MLESFGTTLPFEGFTGRLNPDHCPLLFESQMFFLVTIPSLPKRIQQHADSAEQAIQTVFNNLPERLKKETTLQECFAVELEDPMMQFVPSELE